MSQFGTYRYELKFLVRASQRNAMIEAVGDWVAPDSFGEGGLYRVTSQYYDSPDLRAYWEKLDGVNLRSKFRLRFYGAEPESPFFEIKHRANQTIFKERVALGLEGALKLLGLENELRQISQYAQPKSRSDRSLLSRLEQTAVVEPLQPTAVISYKRAAYVGKVDPKVRLTFDHHCQAHRPGQYATVASDDGLFLQDPSLIVMELKFNGAVPRWLRDAANEVRGQPVRFSKYAHGVECLTDLQTRRIESMISQGV